MQWIALAGKETSAQQAFVAQEKWQRTCSIGYGQGAARSFMQPTAQDNIHTTHRRFIQLSAIKLIPRLTRCSFARVFMIKVHNQEGTTSENFLTKCGNSIQTVCDIGRV